MNDTSEVAVVKKKWMKLYSHPRIAVDGFLYNFQKYCKRHTRWRCNRFWAKCPSVLKTTLDLNKLKIVGFEHDHVHPDDTEAIVRVQYRLANPKEKYRGFPTKQSTLYMFNMRKVFDHQNGKLLHPNRNGMTLKRQIHEHSKNTTQNTNTNANENSNIKKFKHLNSQNKSINLTSQNKTEIDVIVEQNMHCSTSHINIETHSPIHQEMKSKCSSIENKINKNIYSKQDSNQVIEISDDDDDYYKVDRNNTQFDSVTSSGKKKNFWDVNQKKVTHPCQENVLASMASTSSKKSVTLQSTESVLEIQQTPYTRKSTEHLNSNETIPQCSSTLPKERSKKEVEVARIHSSKGVVSISLVDGPKPSTNYNPIYGPLLNKTCSKPHQSTSVSSELPKKKNYGLNNSSTTITPVVNKNGLLDEHTCIDLSNDDSNVDDLGIESTLSRLPVPESIPVSKYFQDLQQEIDTTIPVPKIEVKVPSNWFARMQRKNSSNVELIISFDNYDKDSKIVECCNLYFYKKNKNLSSEEPPSWKLVGEVVPIGYPAQCFIRVNYLGKYDCYFSARAKNCSGKYGDACEPVFVKI